jgi:5-methylcytosine-specific restriction endonuclease McrA
MRNLTPSSLDPFEVFRDVIKAKAKRSAPRHQRLTKRLGIFRQYFREYNDSKHHLETIRTRRHKPNQSEDLAHCYSVRTPPLNELLADIRRNIPPIRSDKCPYCNIEFPKTFDHYLSLGRFPEYSVHALNLLPCCNSCNQIKQEQLLTPAGRRKFLNFYFDHIPETRYLVVEIEQDPTGAFSAEYKLVRPRWFRRNTFQSISDHFESLDLLERYRESSNATFSEVQNSMLAHHSSRLVVRRLLREDAAMWSNEISPNYWKAVLLEAMASDVAFVDSCVA